MTHELKRGWNWRAIVTNPNNIEFRTNVRLRNGGPGTGINGTFYNNGTLITSSIMQYHGRTIGYGVSTHLWLNKNKYPSQAGKPETVLWWDGLGFHTKRMHEVKEVPGNALWAIGGCGIKPNYNPYAEGFTKPFDDVFRRTSHNMIAVKDGRVWLLYVFMNGKQILSFADKMNFEQCILLDGGHAGVISTQKWGRGSKTWRSVNAIMLKEE